MGYDSDNDEDLLKEFYDELFKILDRQVFPLKQRRQQICAIQAIRHFLQDIERTHGKWTVLRIIKAKGEAHDLNKDKPLSHPEIYEAPKTEINWLLE